MPETATKQGIDATDSEGFRLGCRKSCVVSLGVSQKVIKMFGGPEISPYLCSVKKIHTAFPKPNAETSIKKSNIMTTFAFILIVLAASLALNIKTKTSAYNSEHKSVWADGDSVRIMDSDDDYNTSFMQRIA